MRLSDCFIHLIAYVAYFVQSVNKKQPTYEQVKGDISRLISESEQLLKQNTFSRDEYDMGRFAICAWVDEALLNSPWKDKGKWQREPLQFQYYNTADAGVEFFARLNALGLHQRDVREVYYLCLAMGFKGQYHHEKDKFLLDQVRAQNLKIFFGSSLGPPSLDRIKLFPDAYVEEEVRADKKKKESLFSPLTLLYIGLPILIFLILFIMYSFILNDIAKFWLNMVL